MKQSFRQIPKQTPKLKLRSAILMILSGVGVALVITLVTFFYFNVGSPGNSIAENEVVKNTVGIQWAKELKFQSNNYGDSDFSGNQVLGPPDAFPFGVVHRNAYRLKNKSGYGEITVAYQYPTQVEQIIIVENNLTDRIDRIMLHDTDGNKHHVYSGESSVEEFSARILNLKIDKTPYKVEMISVHLNTLDKNGWAQIDAIGICESALSNDQFDKLIALNKDYAERPVKYTNIREKLDKTINTFYREAKPILSPDGRFMYFARQNAPENYNGKKDDQDIYYSEKINGKWSEARNIGSPLNDKYPNGVCSISKDGNTLWVLNAYNEDGSVENGISATHRQENGQWSKPEKLEIENFYNLGPYQDYYMCSDGQTLILALQREETYGDQDLYVSFKKKDSAWSRPANIGATVNTGMSEYAPYLSPEGEVLYFTSNGHSPEGKSEIYYSIRQDGSWLNWSEPKRVHEFTGEDFADAYFAIAPDMKDAYIVCTETGGTGQLDKNIYRVQLELTQESDVDDLIARLNTFRNNSF